MKNKYVLAIVLFLGIIVGTFVVSNVKKSSAVQVKEVFSSSALKSNCNIKNIKEDNENYSIDVYYPETSYNNLNEYIISKLKKIIEEFKSESLSLKDVTSQKQRLEINFDSYENGNYITYVFNEYVDLGGAHPNAYIFTVSYDIASRSIITIDDLIKKDVDILKTFSKISYDTLKENSIIKEIANEQMLKVGTEANKNNFKNFAFDKKGIILFFEKYSVAPYVAGEFSVLIPYDKIPNWK